MEGTLLTQQYCRCRRLCVCIVRRNYRFTPLPLPYCRYSVTAPGSAAVTGVLVSHGDNMIRHDAMILYCCTTTLRTNEVPETYLCETSVTRNGGSFFSVQEGLRGGWLGLGSVGAFEFGTVSDDGTVVSPPSVHPLSTQALS